VILVDRDAYLLALCRSVERNPVAVRLVASAVEWRWSSCAAHVGREPTPPWLDSDGLHGFLLGHAVTTAAQRRRAAAPYAALVAEGRSGDATLWHDTLHGQKLSG
jgi:hypothetical protein